jgi:hypothetical protein
VAVEEVAVTLLTLTVTFQSSERDRSSKIIFSCGIFNEKEGLRSKFVFIFQFDCNN